MAQQIHGRAARTLRKALRRQPLTKKRHTENGQEQKRGPSLFWGQDLYFAAITMISTSAFGSASAASTQARAGRFDLSTQAVQTSFIGARLRMSVTQICAD